MTDPKQQVTTYTYGADDAILSMAFTNTQVATPGVSYTYDSQYGRPATMADGTGTTIYSYHAVGSAGASQLASVDGPLANDTIGYTYDSLGRVTQRTINGSANTATWSHDALGRITNEINILGTFTYGYDGATTRLSAVTLPNGQSTVYAYLPELHNRRLQTIHHKYPNGTTLAKLDYTYDAVGNILSWQQQADGNAPLVWEYGYDSADQLTRAAQKTVGASPSILKRFAWGYDAAGNRLYEQIDDSVTGWTYSSLNRLVTQYGGGTLRFAGQLNEPATVVVAGQPATVSGSGAFERGVQVAGGGTNAITITATDAAGNTATASYQVNINALLRPFTVDARKLSTTLRHPGGSN